MGDSAGTNRGAIYRRRGRRAGLRGLVRIIIKIGRKPAFHGAKVHLFAEMIIKDLVAINLADAEMLRLRVREIKSAHGTGGPHRVTFGELDAGVLLHVEQVPKDSFLGVVRARGVAGGGADASVLFVDQVVA